MEESITVKIALVGVILGNLKERVVYLMITAVQAL